MKVLLACLCTLALATSVSAQARRTVFAPTTAPARTFRPFVVITGEDFAARTSFDATFGQTIYPMWGGGLQVAFRNNLYLDLTVSRFQKTGQRAFVFGGQAFPLAIALDAAITPIEATVGHRFVLRSSPRVVPYVGVGGGWYLYKESSDGDTFSTSHAGALGVAGVEFRTGRLVRLSVDAQYTYIPGILGNDGVSKDAGESNLGGVAGRFRVILGR